jgi:hypothetical protein
MKPSNKKADLMLETAEIQREYELMLRLQPVTHEMLARPKVKQPVKPFYFCDVVVHQQDKLVIH